MLKQAGLLKKSHVLHDRDVRFLSCDTRNMKPETLFICKGEHFLPEYLDTALDQNAIAYVSEQLYRTDVSYLLVTDIRAAMATLAGLFYGDVADKLTSIGITGTKGKSTVAFFVRSILENWKPNTSAIVSSIITDDGATSTKSVNTTPEILDLYAHYEQAHHNLREYMVLEVSSQALKYGRTAGISYEVACFTNFGNDHISPIEHPSIEDYLSAKRSILKFCRTACINRDMSVYEDVLDTARANGCNICTFGFHPESDVRCLAVDYTGHGYRFSVKIPGSILECNIPMHGKFNVTNALAAIAIALSLNVPAESICNGLAQTTVGGRMQVRSCLDNRLIALVDYAHNKLSFQAIYAAIMDEFPGRYCVTVFGSPGEKALNRREELGTLAGIHSDHVIVTEDDSASEEFSHITLPICAALTATGAPFSVIKDRASAISEAFRIAANHLPSIVLVLGKGDDTTQRIGTSPVPYPSDPVIVNRMIDEYERAFISP